MDEAPVTESNAPSDLLQVSENGQLAAVRETGSLAPLFGWAFVGLSGAYLLRALTETGSIPILAGAIAGVVYAAWWLFLAAQRAWEKPLASTVHSVTAALIVAPLLWETTVRFQVITTPVASAALVLFAVFALAIGWRHNVTAIAWIATLAGLITAVALFRETHDAPAWAVTVLAIAAAVEFSACRDHWLGLRWITALIADLTILVLTLIAARQQDLVSPWFMLGAQVALVAIYLASTLDRTLIRKLPITLFEVGQAVAACLVGIGGALFLADATNIGRTPVGLYCLSASVISYVISFTMLERHEDRNRNFYTYSTFGVVLMLVAWPLLIAPAEIAYSALAVCLMFIGITGRRATLRAHSAVFLLFATIGAGVMQHAMTTLMRHGAAPPIDPAYIFVVAAAALCYVNLAVFRQNRAGGWTDSVESFLAVGIAVWGAAGLVASLLSGSALRTAFLTGLAAASVWIGVRLHRRELVWVAYALVAAAGLKLLIEDLRQGQSFGTFASLTLFGATLILVPRLLRGSAAVNR